MNRMEDHGPSRMPSHLEQCLLLQSRVRESLLASSATARNAAALRAEEA